MRDIIDRQELMKKIRCRKNGDCEHCDFFTDGDTWCDGKVFGTIIMQMPTYKPTRSELRRLTLQNEVFPQKRGEWIEWFPGNCALIMTGEEMLYRCSLCDAKYPDVENYKYCPNCGADMRGESNAEDTL